MGMTKGFCVAYETKNQELREIWMSLLTMEWIDKITEYDMPDEGITKLIATPVGVEFTEEQKKTVIPKFSLVSIIKELRDEKNKVSK
jgi:hypothetical protein